MATDTNLFAADRKNDEPSGDDTILSGPFSEYGEFDSSEDEAEDEKFFQFGRFFGVGLGAGLTTATGNAGRLYQGGFPTVNLRLNYWFDFHIALQVSVENSKHNYDVLSTPGTAAQVVDVNMFRALLQVKYYIDTKDLSAPITFVSPHIIVGGGSYQRTDNMAPSAGSTGVENLTSQNAFGLNFGLGLELTLKPKKTYLQLETLAHLVQFGDQYDTQFRSVGINDRSGTWITANVSILWTW